MPPTDKLDLVVVESASNPTVAQLIVGILKEAGIAAWTPGTHLQDAWAISQTRMGLLSVDVLVAREDMDDARRVLARAQKATSTRGSDDADALVASGETLEPGEQTEVEADAQVPPRTTDELWLETGVVLAVALLPLYYSMIADLIWPPLKPAVLQTAWSSIVLNGGLGALLLFLIWRSGEPWSRFGLTRPDALDVGLFVFVLFVDYVLVGNLSYLIELGLFGGGRSQPVPSFERVDRAGYILVIAGTAINAFYQELLMRGYLIPRFERLFRSTSKSLLLTTMLFGAYHLDQGISGVIGSTLSGLVYGAAFCLTRRLWPIAAAHAGYNLVVLLRDIYLTM